MLVAPVCFCVCVCVAHMSQDMQLTGNKQLQKSTPQHTHKKQNTHTHKQTPLNRCPMHTAVFSNVMYTHTLMHTHTSLTLQTHTFPHPHEK